MDVNKYQIVPFKDIAFLLTVNDIVSINTGNTSKIALEITINNVNEITSFVREDNALNEPELHNGTNIEIRVPEAYVISSSHPQNSDPIKATLIINPLHLCRDAGVRLIIKNEVKTH